MVQIVGGKPVHDHLLLITASIMIVGGVKRLVYVADEMQQELQSDEPLVRSGFGVGKLGLELVDLIDDASIRRAARCERPGWQSRMVVAGLLEVRLVELDVDKMQLPGASAALSGAVSN